MTMEYRMRGRLEFSNDDAVKAAKALIRDEGYDWEEGLVGDALRWSACALEIDTRGSTSYDDFDLSTDVLRMFAQHAHAGEIRAANLQDGYGQRFLPGNGDEAGGACVELTEGELDELRRTT